MAAPSSALTAKMEAFSENEAAFLTKDPKEAQKQLSEQIAFFERMAHVQEQLQKCAAMVKEQDPDTARNIVAIAQMEQPPLPLDKLGVYLRIGMDLSKKGNLREKIDALKKEREMMLKAREENSRKKAILEAAAAFLKDHQHDLQKARAMRQALKELALAQNTKSSPTVKEELL